MSLGKLSGLLHTLSCTKQHSDKMEDLLSPRLPQVCYYYLEETLAEDDRPDHAKWEGVAKELCEKTKATPADVVRTITQLLDLRRRLDVILTANPRMEDLSRLVLFGE